MLLLFVICCYLFIAKIINSCFTINFTKQNASGFKGSSVASAACGRLVCDVKISAKELIRCRSYDLTELVNQVLKGKRQVVDAEEIPSRFK